VFRDRVEAARGRHRHPHRLTARVDDVRDLGGRVVNVGVPVAVEIRGETAKPARARTCFQPAEELGPRLLTSRHRYILSMEITPLWQTARGRVWPCRNSVQRKLDGTGSKSSRDC
jgi:hypothetical protein